MAVGTVTSTVEEEPEVRTAAPVKTPRRSTAVRVPGVNAEKVDRRVRKTKRQLREALTTLLLQKSFSEITVREISELADVNRGTFYAHYRDVNDLLAQVEESVFLRLEEISVTNRSRSGDDALFTYLTDVMTLCRDSADIYRALVIRNNDIDFQQRLLEALKSHYLRSFVEHSSSAAERDQEYFCSFAVHGMLSMTNDWMESGLRETPEDIARYGADFILRGLQGLN